MTLKQIKKARDAALRAKYDAKFDIAKHEVHLQIAKLQLKDVESQLEYLHTLEVGLNHAKE